MTPATDPTLRRLPADFLDRLRDLLATVRVGHALLAAHGDDAPLARAARLARRVVGAGGAVLYALDDARGELEIVAAAGDAYAPLVGRRIGRTGLVGYCLDDGQPLAVAAPPGTAGGLDGDELAALAGAPTRSQLVAPILAHGAPAGALELRDAPDPRGFTPAEVELAVEVASVAAAAVESHRGERLLAAMFAAVLPRALDPARGPTALAEELDRWLDEVRATPAYRRELALAARLRALAHDEAGLALAEDVVEAVLRAAERRAGSVP